MSNTLGTGFKVIDKDLVRLCGQMGRLSNVNGTRMNQKVTYPYLFLNIRCGCGAADKSSVEEDRRWNVHRRKKLLETRSIIVGLYIVPRKALCVL